ncbi:MAG: response regulator [Anaerovoracaceae bacterium]
MIKAIIVDDEPAISDIIKKFIELKQLPISIVGCSKNGAEGLNMILKYKPYFVFLDIRLPDTNGLEIIKKIKEKNISDINFIIITAYSVFEYAQSALRLGAKDILLKPLDLNQFYKTVVSNMGFEYTNNYLINNLLLYINEHYSENITLQKSSQDLYVTPQYLSRIFKNTTGMNFNKYLNKIRIEQSKELLIHSDMTIQEIALNVGYNNINNFYVQFKSITGVTPSCFQNEHHNKNKVISKTKDDNQNKTDAPNKNYQDTDTEENSIDLF